MPNGDNFKVETNTILRGLKFYFSKKTGNKIPEIKHSIRNELWESKHTLTLGPHFTLFHFKTNVS